MPNIILLAGPNGAGKSTAAPYLLAPETTFLNADDIARELKAHGARERVDIEAGRLLLQQLDALERAGADIAVETTLASRSLAPRIARLRVNGYRFHLLFLWLPSNELAADTWRLYENSRLGKPRLIASGGTRVRDAALWERIRRSHGEQRAD